MKTTSTIILIIIILLLLLRTNTSLYGGKGGASRGESKSNLKDLNNRDAVGKQTRNAASQSCTVM